VIVAGMRADASILHLLALDGSETVSIGRGENSGRSVQYTNVVLGEQNPALWSAETLTVNRS